MCTGMYTYWYTCCYVYIPVHILEKKTYIYIYIKKPVCVPVCIHTFIRIYLRLCTHKIPWCLNPLWGSANTRNRKNRKKKEQV